MPWMDTTTKDDIHTETVKMNFRSPIESYIITCIKNKIFVSSTVSKQNVIHFFSEHLEKAGIFIIYEIRNYHCALNWWCSVQTLVRY